MPRTALTAALATGLSLLAAQEAAPADVPAAAPTISTPDGLHRVPRASGEIQVDGLLDEADWGQALMLDLPFEVWPADNTASRVPTEALLLYDDARFYVAFRAHDHEPGSIRARFSDRDAAFQDDFVGVVLDTFNDERRAFEFFVNPVGVQMDLVVDDLVGGEDSSWDAIWHSAGKLTEGGYVVEMAIPYTSLRFQRGAGDQVWGLDLIRIWPREQRYLMGMNKRDRNVDCYLCQVSKVVGFDGARPGKNLEITPTFTAIRTDEAPVDGSVEPPEIGGLKSGSTHYDPGLTVKWGVTPNMTLSGALNPDFSQVEADAAQLDVNEQFTLFFPEKRPFFLEGSDFFDTPLRTVHTRAIADPEWGTKLTGKEGKNALGFFAARDDVTNLIFPGPQGSSATSMPIESTGGVARYRRDVGKSSALGALATVRQADGYSNGVFGFDGQLRPKDTETILFQILGSSTEYPGDIALDFGQKDGTLTGHALRVDYRHNERNWSAWGRYFDIGDDFRADLGFITQVDVRMPILGYEYRWWGDPNDWYTRFEWGGDFDQTTDQDGNLIERELESWFNFGGPKQSFFFVGGGARKRGFREEIFDQTFVNFFAGFQPFGNLEVGLDGGVSERVDFAFEDPADPEATRQGDELRLIPSLRYDLGRHVRINLSHEVRLLDVDGGRAFRADLTQLRLAYQLNIRTFFRAILQLADVERDTDVYPACVADPLGCGLRPERRGLFSQLLFSYKINPQTALFLGYSDNQLAGEGADLDRTDRTFFFKVGYAWVR